MADRDELVRRLRALAGNLDSDDLLRAACFEAATALSAQQPVASAERWHGLVEQLAQRFKGYLPWPDDLRGSVVRGHEMFIEDTLKKADAFLNAAMRGEKK